MTNKLLALVFMGFITVGSAFGAAIDLRASGLDWHGSKVTGKHFGSINFSRGDVDIKDGKLVGGDFVVDMKSIDVSELSGEWKEKFLTHISSKDFFVVEKYPTSKLKIKSVKGNMATADLTIKGKTNEVKFDIKQVGKSYSGVLKFDRTKFGMVYGSGDYFKGLGDKLIHNEVKVSFKFVVKS